jgi:hypothetical protein
VKLIRLIDQFHPVRRSPRLPGGGTFLQAEKAGILYRGQWREIFQPHRALVVNLVFRPAGPDKADARPIRFRRNSPRPFLG